MSHIPTLLLVVVLLAAVVGTAVSICLCIAVAADAEGRGGKIALLAFASMLVGVVTTSVFGCELAYRWLHS